MQYSINEIINTKNIIKYTSKYLNKDNINKNNIENISENIIYNFDIINYDKNSKFQTFNNILCNAMIIFENILQKRKLIFFKNYKNFININHNNTLENKVSKFNKSSIIRKNKNINYYFHITNIIIIIIFLMPSIIYILLDIIISSQNKINL